MHNPEAGCPVLVGGPLDGYWFDFNVSAWRVEPDGVAIRRIGPAVKWLEEGHVIAEVLVGVLASPTLDVMKLINPHVRWCHYKFDDGAWKFVGWLPGTLPFDPSNPRASQL